MEKLPIRGMGMVIDHIPGNATSQVYRLVKNYFGHDERVSVGVAKDAPVDKADMVWIDGVLLWECDRVLNEIGILAPSATVMWIESGSIQHTVNPAREVVSAVVETDVIKCPNWNCISHTEAPPKFRVLAMEPFRLQCYYCKRDLD